MCKAALAEKVKEYGVGYGMDIYSDTELLSLATGIDPELFTETLNETFNNPRAIKGIGERKTLTLLAIKELAKRLACRVNTKVEVIHGPEDVARFAMPRYRDEKKEHFAILLLNTKNHIIGLRDISIGSLTASVVHPREVFREAVIHAAASIILIHNHPSGDPSPSREDISVTQRLVKAGRIFDVPVLDHIILGDNRWVSLKEKGLLQ